MVLKKMSNRQGILLASPYEQRKLEKWITPACPFVFGQRKLNGERLKWEQERLVSSEANLVTGIPHIVAELQETFHNINLDGEAYCHGMSLQQIHSIVSRSKGLHPSYKEIKFHVFDTPNQEAQVIRLMWLYRNKKRFDGTEYILLEDTFRITSHVQALEAVNNFVGEGYEGLILRHPNGLYIPMSRAIMMKWKPKKFDTYEIVEVLQGLSGKYEGTMGALIVKDKEGRQFHVGSFKLDDSERDYHWQKRDQLVGAKCKIRYVELTKAGIPPSSTFIEMAAEEDDD